MAEHEGLEPVHVESGKSFDEIAAERAAASPPAEAEPSESETASDGGHTASVCSGKNAETQLCDDSVHSAW